MATEFETTTSVVSAILGPAGKGSEKGDEPQEKREGWEEIL